MTNIPAPNNSPNTSWGLEFEMPANVEKISGAPLPNAKIVTPAMLSESLCVKTYCKIKFDRLLICYLLLVVLMYSVGRYVLLLENSP